MIYRTTNIADRFVETANLHQDKIAVIYNDEEISFEELKKISNHIAWKIHQKVNTNSPVAVFISSKANVVISNLGILLSGNFL